MKSNEFNIRPSSGCDTAFSVYWHYDINHAKELYSGCREFCDDMLQMIQEALNLIRDKVYSNFTEQKFCDFEDVEDEILNIHIGALNFEFVSRDFHDGYGGEVNCECFLLGKGTYGVTEKKRDGVDGIPYDDEYCMNYFHKDTNHDFEKTRQLVIDEMSEFVILDAEKLCKAVEKDFTWDSLTEK